jgi:phosphopantetheine adenylyltransferase
VEQQKNTWTGWQKDIEAEIMEFDRIGHKFDFSKYDTIIVSSGTYMGLMPLNSFLKRNWKKLRNMNVVAVAVGAAPAEDPWSKWSYDRISRRIRDKIKYFKILGESAGKDKEQKPSPVKRENLAEIIKYMKGIK